MYRSYVYIYIYIYIYIYVQPASRQVGTAGDADDEGPAAGGHDDLHLFIINSIITIITYHNNHDN